MDTTHLSTIKYDVYDNPHRSARLGIINPIANAINTISWAYVRGTVHTHVERRITLPYIENEITHEYTKNKV